MRHGSSWCLWAAAAALLPGSAAWAACSRVIQVPAAPTGFSVIVSDERVGGVYPDVLRAVGAAAGCSFSFRPVPRARLDQMFFKTGEADVLIPASRTPERDAQAQFVPLITVQPSLITLAARQLQIGSVQALIEDRQLRAAVVRSYSYGEEYQALLAALDKDKRVDYVSDLSKVVSMISLGRVDFTIMAPTLFYSSVKAAGSGSEFAELFRYAPLRGLQTIESGAYLSTKTLSPADLATLRRLLEEAARNGALWTSFQQYYPADILNAVVTRR